MAFDALLIDDFRGGLDLVSSLNNIPNGFTPNALNFRIADYGGIEKVLGYSAFATLGANAHELFYFEKRDGSGACLVAAEPTAWQKVDSAGTVTNIRTALTTVTETSFVMYEDKLYGLDAQNIMASWDGTSVVTFATGVSTGPNKGIILGIWSNRMYIAKATSGAIGMRVEWSAAGDFTSWPAANFVELGGPGTSDRIMGGVPTSDGLVIFTSRSTYLLYDSSSGANRVIDPRRGCSSRKSLAVVGDTIFGVNREGVFATTGTFAQRLVSDRVAPLFRDEAPTLSQCAGVSWNGSYLTAFQRPSASNNNLTLEYDPSFGSAVGEGSGSMMAFQYPAYAWAQGPLSGAEQRLYFVDASDRTKVRRAFNGGDFAGTAISCYYDTPPMSFGDEVHQKRLRKVRMVGRGNLYVGVLTDYEAAVEVASTFAFPALAGGTWGSFLWGTGTWGGYSLFEGWARVSARARRFSLRFYESSSSTYPTRSIEGVDSGSLLGGCGVYLVEPHFSRTSREMT